MLTALARRAHGIGARVRVLRFRARVRYAAAIAGASVQVAIDRTVVCTSVPEVYVVAGTTNRLAIGRGVTFGSDVRLELRGGELTVGAGSAHPHGVRLNIGGRVEIGDEVVVSTGVHLHCAQEVTVDRWTIIGEYTTIADSNHARTAAHVPVHHAVDVAPVHVGANVWIGAKATIAKGVTVGDQAFVAANAVVVRDVEPWWLVAGNPASPVRRLEPSDAGPPQNQR